MLLPGHRIERYELVAPIAERRGAQVWLAKQRPWRDDEPVTVVALKIVFAPPGTDPAFRTRFLDHARSVASIVHPNVARIVELGEAGGLLYVALEWVDGESAGALMASAASRYGLPAAPVPLPIALRIAADACAGLHGAHHVADAAGRIRAVVHGDLRPEDVLVTVRGEVKLIGFGERAPTTNEPLGPLVDVLGAGATLHRMLSGRPPLPGGGELAAPPSVVAIVQRALAPAPSDRYPSALAMQNALEAAIAREGLSATSEAVAAWVHANLSEAARARGSELARLGLRPGPPGAKPASENPEFIDVRAIVARAPSTPHRQVAAPQEDAPPKREVSSRGRDLDDEASEPVELKPVVPATVGVNAPTSASASWKPFALAAALLCVAAAVGLALAPTIIEKRVIAGARDAGVELHVGDVSLGIRGVALRNVTGQLARVPGVSFRIEEIGTVGLTTRELRVRGFEATLDGPFRALSDKLVDFAHEQRTRLSGTKTDPKKLNVVSARFTWSAPFGAGTHIEGAEGAFEIESRGSGAEEVRASVGRLEAKTSRTTVGPWAALYERTATSARARLLFDPPLPDGPSAMIVWNGAGSSQLTVRIPRSPLANLGVRPAEIGLPADGATEAEVKIDGTRVASGRVEGQARVDLWNARLAGFKGPIDVRLDGAASGVADKPLALEKTTVTVGPFVSNIAGTLDVQDEGPTSGPLGWRARLDATWRTQPIACEKIVRGEASKLGPVAQAIQDIAHRTGAARVTGTASASGVIKLDTDAPNAPEGQQERSMTFTTKDTCGLSIFGL